MRDPRQVQGWGEADWNGRDMVNKQRKSGARERALAIFHVSYSYANIFNLRNVVKYKYMDPLEIRIPLVQRGIS